MKKLTLILLLLSFSVFAQNPDSTKKQLGLVIKGDILLPIIGLFDEGYYCSFTIEKFLKKRHSIQLTYFEFWLNTPDGSKSNYRQLIPEYKFFVSKKKLCNGYYIGAYGQFLSEKYNFQNNEGGGWVIERYKTILIGGGICTGVQFYLLKKLTIDVMFGLGIVKPINYYEAYFYDGGAHPLIFDKTWYAPYYNGRAAINIGYKF